MDNLFGFLPIVRLGRTNTNLMLLSLILCSRRRMFGFPELGTNSAVDLKNKKSTLLKHFIILPNNVIIVWKCNKAWKNSVMKVHCQRKLLIHFHFQALVQLPHITVVNLSKNYPLKGFRLSTYKSLQHPPRDVIILLIKIGFLVDFFFANYITFSGSGTYWTPGPVGLCYTSLGRGGCIWLYCSITFYWGNTEKMLKQLLKFYKLNYMLPKTTIWFTQLKCLDSC